MMELRKLWMVPATLVALGGCARDDGPLGPGTARDGRGAELQSTLSCQVSVRGGEIWCGTPNPELGGAAGAVIGGQGVYVHLESSDVSYDAGSEVFSAQVTVRNLIDQVIGSADGQTIDPDGVRIFFVNEPVVTGGSGSVTVKNADGTAEFTSAGQEYFQYPQALAPGKRSVARRWEWNVPNTVESFTFLVGVSAKVADEASLNPGLRFDAQRISADSMHTCVLDLGGRAYCWGAGGSGQLGDGTSTSQATPVAVAGDLRFAVIGVGHLHSCGITVDGVGYCWGAGGNGRLGNDTTSSQSTPGEILGGHTWISINASSSNTCGVTSTGEGYCWGFGTTGRNGDGSGEHKYTPTRVADPPNGPVTWAMISPSHQHTCGLATDGTAYCWGNNSYGRLGRGEVGGNNAFTPEPVATTVKFKQLVAGEYHNCGVALDGTGYCWGLGSLGRLGNGSNGDTIPYPVEVVGGLKFSKIGIGISFGCGLTVDGDVYCWGNASNGRLGNGSTTGSVSSPVKILGDHKFASLAVGLAHSCGVTIQGEVFCWGYGSNNRLGNGSTEDKSEPTYVPGLSNIAWHESLPAMRCGDGSQRASCFPARQSLESYALAGLIAVPRRVELPLSVSASLAGA